MRELNSKKFNPLEGKLVPLALVVSEFCQSSFALNPHLQTLNMTADLLSSYDLDTLQTQWNVKNAVSIKI